MISIITINFNNKLGLQETIDSVLSQSYTDFEYIVIDGNSSDGSKEVLKSLPASVHWISEPDTGIYNAMNKGIKKASGDYLLFLNSGDTLRSTTILGEVLPFLKTDKDIYYGTLAMQHIGGEKIRAYPKTLSFYYFFHTGSLPHPCMFIKRALFDSVGFYDEAFKIVSDWDFYVKAICKYQCSYQNIPLIISNFDMNGISSNPETRSLLLKEKQKSLQNNFSLFYSDYLALQAYKSNNSLKQLDTPLQKLAHNKIALKIYIHTSRLYVKLFGNTKHEKN